MSTEGDGGDGVGDAAAIWHQNRIPVIWRLGKKRPLLIRLPSFVPASGEWLRDEQRRRPQWSDRWNCWVVPLTWLNRLVRRIVFRFGSTYLIQPFREKEICAPACWNAIGFECECSCMGKNHGMGTPEGKWYIHSETLAIQHKDRKWACSRITRATL